MAVATRLNVGIIGSTGDDPRYQPGRVFAPELAHTLCLLLNAAPRTFSQLVAASGSSESQVSAVLESLADLEAVREDEGKLAINFSLLTREDTASIHQLVEGAAHRLAGRVWGSQGAVYDQLHRLAGPDQPGSFAQLALATVGCFSLDWAGIHTLKQLGYVGTGRGYPDGGRYVLTAEEPGGPPAVKDYCGSRTAGGRFFYFTSFGDSSGPRHCLPDLFFRAQGMLAQKDWPPGLDHAVLEVVNWGLREAYDRLGAMATGASPPEGPGVGLLQTTGYLDGNRPATVVFRAAHADSVLEIMRLLCAEIAAWAQEDLPMLTRELAPLSPVRNHVHFPDFLNHAWHYIFAQVNRTLAEGGYMLDPGPAPGQGRYLAWVAEAGFYQRIWQP
jgi:hypothetical protein